MSSDGEEVEASEDTNGGRESVVSFDVNGDGETILDYSDHFVKSYKSHDAQSHDSHSHNEGRDRLGPMEGDNQAPKPLPNASMNVTQVHSRRVSHVRDLTTGKQGGVRAHKALIRSETSGGPMCASTRRRRVLKNFFTGTTKHIHMGEKKEEEESEEDVSVSMHGRLRVSSQRLDFGLPNDINDLENGTRQGQVQYRLQAVAPPSQPRPIARWLGFSGGPAGINEESGGRRNSGFAPFFSLFSQRVNNLVVTYLHWTFRSSFAAFFLSAAIAFFALTIFFALLIWALGRKDPTCIGGADFESDFFADAYALSWTTFSTVGYGVIYSGTSATEKEVRKCTGVTIIVTLEAFVGILFASFCGAILFAKVSRIQSFAQVLFSDPIVIRYGTGVMVETDDASDDGSNSMDTDVTQMPCPVLEFRMMNHLHSTVGGEIIDATINIVASIDASQACPTVRNATERRRRGKKGKKLGARQRAVRQSDPSMDFEPESKSSADAKPAAKPTGTLSRPTSTESLLSLGQTVNGVDNVLSGRTHQAFDEDPTGHLVPRRIFSKLEVESPDHPFFTRAWMVRHTLNQHSPLLRAEARKMLKDNHGFWPRELNSHEGVRSAVQFDKILVSMSGTSNADANSVYAQKVYDFVDVNVGYRFVNPLYRDTDGGLHVDTSLINDVSEQAGGGGEPFTISEEVKHHEFDV